MNLFRAASLVSFLTLLSRITGLVREQMVAAMFGASAVTDAFNVAFRLPNLLRRLFAEGAFSQAFIPLFAATRARDGDAATRDLLDAVASVLIAVLLVVSIAGVVFAPVLLWLMASGLQAGNEALWMTRVMFPYILLMSMVALAAGVLNTWKKFVVPAATPVLLNLSMIACAALLAPWFGRHGVPPIYAMAVGVMLGGVLQLGVQVPALWRLGMVPRLHLTPAGLRAAWHHPGVRHVLRQMAPAILGVSVAQISLLINTQLASHVGPGAVSWLTYADRLMEFPTALLGVALGVVLLPQLSAARARDELGQYSQLLDWGLRLVLLFSLPCAVALLLFGEPLVAVLYHYGAFRPVDVAETVVSLQGYGVGLLGLVAIKVLAPGFYAQQNLRTPVKIAIGVLILTQVLNLVTVPRYGQAGLALSIGIAALCNAGLLLVGLVRGGLYQPQPGWALLLVRVAAAAAVLGGALFYMEQHWDWLTLAKGQRVMLIAGCLAAAVALYFAVLTLLGLRWWRMLRRAAL